MVKNLKLLRLQRNISQQQLAEQIGVSQQSINKYENHDTEPNIDTLCKFAAYFHTSVDYLVGHSEIDHVIEVLHQDDLNMDEASLLDGYRSLSPKEKESIHLIIKNYRKK